MKWLLFLALLSGTWFGGGYGPWPSSWKEAAGRTYTLSGTALTAKVGPLLRGPSQEVWVDLPAWPAEVEGKQVWVTGRVVRRDDLPVTDDAYSAGVPGGSSERWLLTDVRLVRR